MQFRDIAVDGADGDEKLGCPFIPSNAGFREAG